MKGDSLPNNDHIARYCAPASLSEEGHPTGASFMPRRVDRCLSVNWMEYFGGSNRKKQIKKIRKDIPLTLKKRGVFAVLNVGNAKNYVRKSKSNKKLDILHEPSDINPSHSGVYGYTHEDLVVADLIAETVEEVLPINI